jgi:hypothetical protein
VQKSFTEKKRLKKKVVCHYNLLDLNCCCQVSHEKFRQKSEFKRVVINDEPQDPTFFNKLMSHFVGK